MAPNQREVSIAVSPGYDGRGSMTECGDAALAEGRSRALTSGQTERPDSKRFRFPGDDYPCRPRRAALLSQFLRSKRSFLTSPVLDSIELCWIQNSRDRKC